MRIWDHRGKSTGKLVREENNAGLIAKNVFYFLLPTQG